MKIYNEVVTIFNDITGQWETISEDSYNYNGPVALTQGVPANSSPINTSDTIADTIKTTAGYFSDGDGTLAGTSIYTGSLADSNEKYYFNVNHLQDDGASADTLSSTQFSVTFGHYAGSGSDTYGDSADNPNTLKGATQAIYNQLTTVLLDETEQSGGFFISGSDTKDEYVYALIGKRDKFKDRFNKKAWTLTLSGWDSIGQSASLEANGAASSSILYLTDDSETVAATATVGGPRYNIVSGTLGVAHTAATSKCYGWLYPESGIMLFSGRMLAEAIPGVHSGSKLPHATQALFTASISDWDQAARFEYTADTCGFYSASNGLTPYTSSNSNAYNALRFVNAMRQVGSSTTLRLRSEEDQTQENYFCRVRAEEYNFTANPNFVSGSKNKIRAKNMHGNPQTFITSVGLYNSAGQMLATAKLSKPLKKNFATEATIKVKLTY